MVHIIIGFNSIIINNFNINNNINLFIKILIFETFLN